MRIAAAALILAIALVAAGCAQQQTETSPDVATAPEQSPPEKAAPGTLKAYYDSIDYSCSSSQDCEVKNIGNCCGEDPRCVNRNSRADPQQVIELCAKEEASSICGFQAIEACECKSRKCQAVQ
ncbi:hypothetical protein HYY74_03145 [Candidatus Woesearchaeota archaeon]|nr:hypothetical protein [Candidatus Woesearchaeota archaeon]